MPKPRYSEAKKQAKELYDLVPYITPRIAFRYIQQLDLPKEQIPISHTILFEWFKEFDKVSNKDRYEKLMALWLKENPLKINADMPKKKIIDKNK